MNRIVKTFGELKKEGKKALIIFLTAGDPSLSATKKFVFELEKSGADIIELGVPFSDPMADGPVIQAANERALKKGTTLEKILRLVRDIRRKSQVPLLLMGYYNPIFAYGLKKFARDAANVGVDAVLVVDLPPEEAGDLRSELKKVGIHLIFLLAPTSDSKRIKLVAKNASGFIYLVSITGVTGSKNGAWKKGDRSRFLRPVPVIKKIRRETKLPIVIGFGISGPEDIKKFSFADGVVIGSAIVRRIASRKSVGSFVRSFRFGKKLD